MFYVSSDEWEDSDDTEIYSSPLRSNADHVRISTERLKTNKIPEDIDDQKWVIHFFGSTSQWILYHGFYSNQCDCCVHNVLSTCDSDNIRPMYQY